MAVFEYRCGECRLQVEKLFRKEAPPTIPCPDCGSDSLKQIADFGFVFGDGKVTGNTGVDSLDSNIDINVGRSAKSRWEFMKDRATRKREVQRDAGGLDVPVQKTPDGDYTAMSGTDLKRFNKLHKEYSTHLESHRSERKAKGKGQFDE